MALRPCFLVVALLALSLAHPVFAQSPGGDATASESPKMRAKAKRDGASLSAKKKKAKKAEEEPKAEAASAPEPAPEPDTWERPPVEDEKPPAPPPPVETETRAGNDLPWSVGLLAGWGFKTDRRTANFGADPYGLGAGLRGGYSLDVQLYVGLFVIYYLGSSETGNAARTNDPTITATASYLQIGAEAGYDWWVGPVMVRPSLLIGPAIAFTDNPQLPRSSVTSLMLAPGLTVVHPIDEWFIGGDLRGTIVTGNGVSDVLLAATAGLRFN
jgi:hypothetical protein